MDHVQVIVDALVKGAAPVAKEMMTDACKRAYNGLKDVLRRKMASTLITQQPLPAPAVLRSAVEVLDVETLTEAASQARVVLQYLQPTLSQQAYSLSIDGDVGNLVQGSGVSVTIIQDAASTRKRRRRQK